MDEDCLRFLEFLARGYSGEWYWETRTIVTGERARTTFFSDIHEIDGWRNHNLEKGNLYIGIAPRNKKRGKKEFVPVSNVIYADIDTPHAADKMEEIRMKLDGFGISLSAAVVSSKSKGKLQIYIKLDSPVEAAEWHILEDKFRALVEREMPWTILDKNVRDITRVLRLPSSLNYKYDPPEPCVLAECNDATTPAEVVRAIDIEVKAPQTETDMVKDTRRKIRVLPQHILNIIETGVNKEIGGDRHYNEWLITKEMHMRGFDDEEIMAAVLLFNSNCKPSKTEYEIKSHVNNLLGHPDDYLVEEVDRNFLRAHNFGVMNDKSEGGHTYDSVIAAYKKWIRLEDYKVVDLCLATALTRKLRDAPLWPIIIAPSGGSKTEILRPFEDKREKPTTEIMSKITKNTFLSGMKEGLDFAETLRGSPKLFLTFDFAQFVKLNSEEKAAIWAQLRDIYDGFIERKAGLGVHKKVDNIKVNWIICTTPVIDTELLVAQELGTREILYRFQDTDVKEDEVMEQVWTNAKVLNEMRAELADVVRGYINEKDEQEFKYFEIDEKMKNSIMNYAKFISVLRAATEVDNYTGELTNFVYKEMPTRILQQLRLLFIALKNLDDKYTNEQALEVIKRVALSSIHPIRLKIILEVVKNGADGISTTQIQKNLNIGWKTVKTQLYTARQLGVVDYNEDIYDNEEKWGQMKKTWFAVEGNDIIKFIKYAVIGINPEELELLLSRGRRTDATIPPPT